MCVCVAPAITEAEQKELLGALKKTPKKRQGRGTPGTPPESLKPPGGFGGETAGVSNDIILHLTIPGLC